MRTLMPSVCAALVGACLASPASAATYLFDFGSAGSGQFVTDDVEIAPGQYRVTSITGTALGATITNLIQNPLSPNDAFYSVATQTVGSSPSGFYYQFNNLFSPGGPTAFNAGGLLFQTTDQVVNFYAIGNSLFAGANLIGVSNFDPLAQPLQGTITAAGVPEPGTWALLFIGFGAVAGAMRLSRRRTRVTLAYS